MNNRLKNTDWLATFLYPLFVVLMETFWVYPWLLWMGTLHVFLPPRPALSLAAVFIVMAAAVLTVRYLIKPQWSLRAAQSLVVGAGLLVMLLTIGIEYRNGYILLSTGWFKYMGSVFAATLSHPSTLIIALPALVYLWWRGINLGQSTSYFKNVYNSFVIGLVALIFLIVFWQFGSVSGAFNKPGANVGLDIIAFFFFGLMAIAVTHLYQMRGAMSREETGLLSVRRWLPIMLVVIGGIVIIVFFFAGAFSEGFFTSAGQAFAVIGRFLGKIIEYISIPLNYLFIALIWVLRFIINLLRGQQMQEPQSNNVSSGPLFPEVTTVGIPHIVGVIIQWFVIAVIVGAVVFFIARAVSRYRERRVQEDIDQLDESLLSWRGLNEDLQALFAAMAKRFQRRPAAGRRFSKEESGSMEIREIYRRFLEEGALSGYERGRFETPAEYASRLGSAVPDGREPLERLTEIYDTVRYGEITPPPEKVENANGLWQTLRRLLRGIRGAN
jgi:hypothetical protein